MYYAIYDSTTGLIVGGPLSNPNDAARLANRYPDNDVLSVDQKIINRFEKRVDLVAKQLRDWTAQEVADYNTAKEIEDVAQEARKNNVKNSKGQGVNVPDIRDRLDEVVAVLQDIGLIPSD